MINNEKNLIPYTTKAGKQPFIEWLNDTDLQRRMMVLTRLQRIRLNNFGDCPYIKGSDSDLLRELRFHDHSGTRVYIREYGKEIVIFFTAGDKDTQNKDIKKVKDYWKDYKSRNPEIKETILESLERNKKGGKNK